MANVPVCKTNKIIKKKKVEPRLVKISKKMQLFQKFPLPKSFLDFAKSVEKCN